MSLPIASLPTLILISFASKRPARYPKVLGSRGGLNGRLIFEREAQCDDEAWEPGEGGFHLTANLTI
jgi:hypothetical protein